MRLINYAKFCNYFIISLSFINRTYPIMVTAFAFIINKYDDKQRYKNIIKKSFDLEMVKITQIIDDYIQKQTILDAENKDDVFEMDLNEELSKINTFFANIGIEFKKIPFIENTRSYQLHYKEKGTDRNLIRASYHEYKYFLTRIIKVKLKKNIYFERLQEILNNGLHNHHTDEQSNNIEEYEYNHEHNEKTNEEDTVIIIEDIKTKEEFELIEQSENHSFVCLLSAYYDENGKIKIFNQLSKNKPEEMIAENYLNIAEKNYLELEREEIKTEWLPVNNKLSYIVVNRNQDSKKIIKEIKELLE